MRNLDLLGALPRSRLIENPNNRVLQIMSDNKFHLKVASREGIVFEGDVDSITSFNEKGKFDVLASHANFISLIKNGLTVREVGGTEGKDTAGKKVIGKEIGFDNALIRVRENNVEVYLGIEGMGVV
jgi:hypothetical protein